MARRQGRYYAYWKNIRLKKMAGTKADDKIATDINSPGYRERVYEIVRGIPSGRVMTYGQIATLLGEGYTPRTVGYVMFGAGEENVPWQRVINSQGACSTGRIVIPPDKQQRMLEAEGVVFNEKGKCDLKRFRWDVEEPEETFDHPKLFSDD